MRRLVVATGNPGKLAEFSRLLSPLGIEAAGLASRPPCPEPVEDGRTFAENAEKKALHYARLLGTEVLADDSGLEVDALGGAPGVNSARWSDPGATPARNNEKLLAALAGLPPGARGARFVCALVLAAPGGIRARARGDCAGRIRTAPGGTGGFGYDPLFDLPDGRCIAALPPTEKDRVSHRGRALRELSAVLAEAIPA